MRNYFLILLGVLGVLLGVSTSAAPEVSEFISDQTEISAFEELPEIEKLEEIEITEIVSNASVPKTISSVKLASVNNTLNYKITAYSSTTVQNPGRNVYKTGKLVYAHNDIFRSVLSLNAGDVFTITDNGVTKTYQVKSAQVFEKVSATKLALCNSSSCSGDWMSAIVNGSQMFKHDVALMTCMPDDHYRKVVFAVEI